MLTINIIHLLIVKIPQAIVQEGKLPASDTFYILMSKYYTLKSS